MSIAYPYPHGVSSEPVDFWIEPGKCVGSALAPTRSGHHVDAFDFTQNVERWPPSPPFGVVTRLEYATRGAAIHARLGRDLPDRLCVVRIETVR